MESKQVHQQHLMRLELAFFLSQVFGIRASCRPPHWYRKFKVSWKARVLLSRLYHLSQVSRLLVFCHTNMQIDEIPMSTILGSSWFLLLATIESSPLLPYCSSRRQPCPSFFNFIFFHGPGDYWSLKPAESFPEWQAVLLEIPPLIHQLSLLENLRNCACPSLTLAPCSASIDISLVPVTQSSDLCSQPFTLWL